VGLLALAAGGLARALAGRGPRARYVGGAGGALGVVLLVALTWQRTEAYGDVVSLWTDTLAKNPGCWMAYAHPREAHLRRGGVRQALEDCGRALELKPDLVEAYATRGAAYVRLGQPERALRECTRAVELRPELAGAYFDRAGVYVRLGRAGEALADYTR